MRRRRPFSPRIALSTLGSQRPGNTEGGTEGGRMKAKDTVRGLLDRLPDDCSLEDVLYHLYVVQAIDRGLADADAGRTISHEEVAERMRRKWVLGVPE